MSEKATVYQPPEGVPVETMCEESTEIQAFSFVVRIWRPTKPVGTKFRGWVEHVQSEQRTHFVGLERVLAIICEQIGIRSISGEKGKYLPANWLFRFSVWRKRKFQTRQEK